MYDSRLEIRVEENMSRDLKFESKKMSRKKYESRYEIRVEKVDQLNCCHHLTSAKRGKSGILHLQQHGFQRFEWVAGHRSSRCRKSREPTAH